MCPEHQHLKMEVLYKIYLLHILCEGARLMYYYQLASYFIFTQFKLTIHPYIPQHWLTNMQFHPDEKKRSRKLLKNELLNLLQRAMVHVYRRIITYLQGKWYTWQAPESPRVSAWLGVV